MAREPPMPTNRQKVADSNQLLRSSSKHNALFILHLTNEIIHLPVTEIATERFRDYVRPTLARLSFDKYPENSPNIKPSRNDMSSCKF